LNHEITQFLNLPITWEYVRNLGGRQTPDIFVGLFETMNYIWHYRSFGLRPSSGTKELCSFLFFSIPDDGQSPKIQ
jgi:hypothetical protein